MRSPALSPAQRAYLESFDRLVVGSEQNVRAVRQQMSARLADVRAERTAR